MVVTVTVGLTGGREVLKAALGIGLHTLATLLPAGGADLAVLVGELEGLDETDGLLDVAADGQVVDGDLAEDAVGVDDEETTQSDTLLLNQDAVAARDLLGSIGDEGQLQVGAEATLLARLLHPGEVREGGVGRDTEDGGVDGLEALESVVVLDDLGGAHKGEVHGVEEEDDPVWLFCQCQLFPFRRLLIPSRKFQMAQSLPTPQYTYHCPL